MINSYDFGLIVINGEEYISDVIVFPEKVIDKWWRKEGHKLYVEDLKEILKHEPKPEFLVIGTGYSGFLKILPEVKEALKSYGIELIAKPTKEACEVFNDILKSGKKVVGAFHLTC
ncbi:MAG: MTH938/NDUFAF3 family protein [Nitrososphaerales archaeon]